MPLYAHFQDFVDGYVGPFDTLEALHQHVEFCRQRGDGAAYLGMVEEVPPGEFVITPEADRTWVG